MNKVLIDNINFLFDIVVISIRNSNAKNKYKEKIIKLKEQEEVVRKQVGGFIFDVGLLGPCGKHAEEAEDVTSMPRTLPRHA